MRRRTVIAASCGALVLTGLGGLPRTVAAATKAERSEAASQMVHAALRHEIEGADAQRDALLQSALEQVPDFAPAMWHSGSLQHGNRWLELDELIEAAADDPRLAAYRKIRQSYPETIDGQLALAQWCGKRKLVDQQRAHLTRVLELSPDHEEARRLLGYHRFGDVWLAEEEISQARARAEREAAALRQWRPKLVKICNDLEHRSQRQRDNAKSRLLAIDDPSAVPALEAVFSRHSEPTATLMIEVLANMPDLDASAALARQAVFSEWQSVREAAAEKLQTRDFHSFVPMLLAEMGTPVNSRAELYLAPSGRLVYRHTFLRKGQQQDEVAVVETEYRRTLLYAENPSEAANSRGMLAEARRRDAMMKAQAREMAVTQRNALIQQLNERIGAALCRATGVKLPATPDSWWKWWNEYNEVFIAGTNPIKGTYRREKLAMEDPYKYVPTTRLPEPRQSRTPVPPPPPSIRTSTGSTPGSRFSRGLPGQRYECLAAGTLVWTELGPVPVEQIRMGDRVVSQDPRTGRLALKPVLKTTLRPPAPTLTIKTADEPIRCSGGHPFWIAGQGWTKARNLKSGQYMHRVTGTTEVRSLVESRRQQTYNLIVSDFHTYFVGLGKILSHDNTVRQSTDTIVPGLANR